MSIEVCKVCGSDKIQGKAWAEINTLTILDWVDDNEVWCPECYEKVETELKQSLKNN